MTEFGSTAGWKMVGDQSQCGLPGEAAESDDDPNVRSDQSPFRLQPRLARRPLVRCRSIGRRGTPHRRDDPDLIGGQAICCINAVRRIHQSGPVQCSEQLVTRSIAGEHSAGSVTAVRGRSQTQHQNSRPVRSPTGDRSSPIRFAGIRATLQPSGLLSPSDQPRTGPADADEGVEVSNGGHSRRQPGHPAATDSHRRVGCRRVSGPTGARRDRDSNDTPVRGCGCIVTGPLCPAPQWSAQN